MGVIEIGKCQNNMTFVDGKLNIGEVMSPPLIRAVKNNIDKNKIVIIDAPPGTTYPAIEAVKGSNFCILVTEPTPFGLNDLKLAVEVLRKIDLPFGVIINRSNIGDKKVVEYCKNENIVILMKIPFKKEIAKVYSNGIPIIEALPEYKIKFLELFNTIKKLTIQPMNYSTASYRD